jgi:hypothetical protein
MSRLYMMTIKKAALAAGRFGIDNMKIETTYTVQIHCGLKIRETQEVQPLDKAKTICQDFVDEQGECVSLTPTEYIYTNGNEPGVIVGFIQYPRVPKYEGDILDRALSLAGLLMIGLSQFKVTVIAPDKTYMLENETLNPLPNR